MGVLMQLGKKEQGALFPISMKCLALYHSPQNYTLLLLNFKIEMRN